MRSTLTLSRLLFGTQAGFTKGVQGRVRQSTRLSRAGRRVVQNWNDILSGRQGIRPAKPRPSRRPKRTRKQPATAAAAGAAAAAGSASRKKKKK